MVTSRVHLSSSFHGKDKDTQLPQGGASRRISKLARAVERIEVRRLATTNDRHRHYFPGEAGPSLPFCPATSSDSSSMTRCLVSS
jgi:hypothetical protein